MNLDDFILFLKNRENQLMRNEVRKQLLKEVNRDKKDFALILLILISESKQEYIERDYLLEKIRSYKEGETLNPRILDLGKHGYFVNILFDNKEYERFIFFNQLSAKNY